MSTDRDRLHAALASCENAGPTSGKAIAEAEVKLGLLFPPGYRQFLELFGASMGEGFEIYGLSDQPVDSPPLWVDVVEATVSLRPDSLPEDTVQISHDGCEIGHFLECSTTEQNFEGKVIEWGAPHGGAHSTGLTFLEFIEQQIQKP